MEQTHPLFISYIKKISSIDNLAESPLSKIDKIDDSNLLMPKNYLQDRDNSDGFDLSEDDNIKLVSQLPKLSKLSVLSTINGQQRKSTSST